MTAILSIFEAFGAYAADGDSAARYRHEQIEPALLGNEKVVLDFAGVRGMNSSFANSLIAGIFSRYDDETAQRLRFRHCNPLVEVMISAAIDLGLERREFRVAGPTN